MSHKGMFTTVRGNFDGYGKLSHQSTDELKVGARIEEGDKKENAPGLRSLESGEGRRNRMGKSLGCGSSGLAHRMFRDGERASWRYD